MKTAVCAALMALLPSLAHAQRADLPSGDVVAAALETHPMVAAAKARLVSAQAQREMLDRGAHEFTLGGSYARRDVDLERGYNEFDASITRALRLPNKATLDRKSGELGVEVAQNMMEDVMHQTALDLSTLWHDWITAGSLYRNDTDTATAMEQALDALRRRAELSDASQLDVDLASASLAQARAQADMSLANREQARVTLAATFSEVPLPAEPPELAQPQLPTQNLQNLRELVIRRSHEIRAADFEAQRLDAVAQRIRADRIADPSVGVRVFSERGGPEPGAGVVLSLPIGGSDRRAAADQAAALADSARQDLLTVQRLIAAMADADLSNAQMRLAAWQSANTSAQSATDALNRTQRGYELGQIDLAELLLIRRQANDARRMEIEARSEANRALLKFQIDSHVMWMVDEDEP
ncbi:MAG: TolC family protein [Nevskiaceae bacterium]|nr:TolC family protein [Nevskiaceae bacterium]